MDEQEKLDYMLGQMHAMGCLMKAVAYRMTTAQRLAFERHLEVTREVALARSVSEHYFQGLAEMAADLGDATK